MYANGVLHTAQTHKTQQLLMFYSSCMTFHGYFCYDCVHMCLSFTFRYFLLLFSLCLQIISQQSSHIWMHCAKEEIKEIFRHIFRGEYASTDIHCDTFQMR